MAHGSDVAGCAKLCCGDWSCESFGFIASWKPADAAAVVSASASATEEPPPAGACSMGQPCCIFKDDVDPLVPGVAGTTTGVRAKLPSQDPPFPTSAHVVGTLEEKL